MTVSCGNCGEILHEPAPEECPSCGRRNRKIALTAVEVIAFTDSARVTYFTNLAERWWSDLQSESTQPGDRDQRRRQLVVAATFADTYLFEWVRDVVLADVPDRWEQLFDLFPHDDRRGVTYRWREVPKRLHDLGLTDGTPNLGGEVWTDFETVVSYRDGLVHGKASRPHGDHFPTEWTPVPTLETLDSLPPEWAENVVRLLIDELHRATNTPTPHWLTDS